MPADARLIFTDLRGTGRSSPALGDALYAESMAWDLARLLERLDVPSAVVLGHSFGALVAMLLAVTAADRVQRLVLVDPDPPLRSDWEEAFSILDARRTEEERDRLRQLEASGEWRTDPTLADAYLRLKLRGYFFEPGLAERIELDLPPETLTSFGQAGATVRDSAGAWDLRPRLGSIYAPTLVVTGPASVYRREALEGLAKALPDGRFVTIPDTGHFPFIEAPDAFRRTLGDFLAA